MLSRPPFTVAITVGLILISATYATVDDPEICVIGAGIAGSSVAHFIKQYTCAQSQLSPVRCMDKVRVFEKFRTPGGRMATVNLSGDVFEAGASIIHPKNYHALNFSKMLGLSRKSDSSPESNSDSEWFGIWDGKRFVFKTLKPLPRSCPAIFKKLYSLVDSVLMFWRYGTSLLRMNSFVQNTVDRFLKYYEDFESRPVFSTVEEMLKWAGLYELTQHTLEEELLNASVSPLLISELITVITRINYGQSIKISGLAGGVSLAGSDPGLWSVKGGNWQLAAGLIKYTNITMYPHEEIVSISNTGRSYVLESMKGGSSYSCDVAVIATPLDELNIRFTPPISIPSRKLQHTFTTFVRGILNPEFFGLERVSDVPDLIGTLELPEIPFSSISVLKKYSAEDNAYKIFSRSLLEDDLLDTIFSKRKETIRINWPAYPHFKAPEVFAPIILDRKHLYYINSFENAASTIETSVVAAENVARLVVSRLTGSDQSAPVLKIPASEQQILHLDL